MDGLQGVIRNILNDLRVELGDEFDKNFERQAFFSEAWQRRRSPLRAGGATLVDTGALRKSIGSRVTGESIVFTTTLPYAAIHKRVGRKIRIPKRAFIGYAPEVEQSAREIIEENLTEYFKAVKLK